MAKGEYIPRRITEVLRDGKWVRVSGLCDVVKGDIFRMFENDGDPVLSNGEIEMYANDTPFIRDGRWTIECCTWKEWNEYVGKEVRN